MSAFLGLVSSPLLFAVAGGLFNGSIAGASMRTHALHAHVTCTAGCVVRQRVHGNSTIRV